MPKSHTHFLSRKPRTQTPICLTMHEDMGHGMRPLSCAHHILLVTQKNRMKRQEDVNAMCRWEGCQDLTTERNVGHTEGRAVTGYSDPLWFLSPSTTRA